MKSLNLLIVIYPTKLLICFAIVVVKLLNIQTVLRDNPGMIFSFHATEQTNCKGALSTKELWFGIPFKKSGC